ncbi:MAG TPA: TonB-dependent receptor [Pyrinomonadaceae bacterium]|nr:TonB-dependent receptor [Pyrinomonadaceae bacterium]
MKRFFFAISTLIILASFSFAQGEKIGTVSGKVTDKLSGQPIEGVTVSNGTTNSQTDNEGNYKLEIPAGTYNLRFSAKGFADVLTAQISITANRTFVQNAQLSIVLSEENVEVKSDVFVSTEEQPVSQTSLNRDEIRNTPGSGGDILRSINSLPSVTSVGAEFGDYIVRGGKTDENLVFIDNIPASDFTLFNDKYDNGKGGRGAVLASDVIQRADFSAGGFGAKYGDKMSSVLDIGIRESNRNRVQAAFFADLGNAGGSIDIPFGKKGGWVSSVRRSYIDVVFDVLNLGDIGRPRNWDFINKGFYDLNDRNKLSFTAINSFESFVLDATQAAASDRRVDRLTTNRRSRRAIMGVTLSTTIGNSTLSQITAWTNIQHNDGSLFRLDTAKTLQRNRDLRDSQFGVKEELTSSLSKKVQLAVGGGIIFEKANYFSFERSGFGFSPLEEEYNAPNRTNRMILDTTTSAYAYGQLTFRPTARFSITPSVRLDRYGLTDETLASPRLSARFQASNKVAVTFATGIYRQTPSLFVMSLTPTNRNLKSQQAFHIVGGVEWLAMEDLRVRAEVFRKKYDDLVIQPVLGNFNYTNAGSGEANGVEISMQKALRGKWAGQISYSYIQSNRRITDNGFAFPADEDRPHQFTAIGITRVWGITLAGKYRYATGLPYDNRTAVQFATNPTRYLQRLATIQNRNALRLTSYNNIDFRAERKFDFKKWSIAPYLDMFNVFAISYKSQVNYEFTRRNPQFLGEGTRIPLFGMRLEF